MIDIFADIKDSPKLYIADVTVTGEHKVRVNSKKSEKIMILLGKVPIVLLNGESPTKRTEYDFLQRVHINHIKKGEFEKMNLKIAAIENVKFSSNLAYEFNYDKH